MMKRKKPTESELEILTILWQRGPSSVRDIHDILSEKKEVYYTTTLKTMQVMTEKGLLTRDTSKRSHIYSPSLAKEEVEKTMISRLANSVFGGSAAQLIISAIGHNKPSREELDEIKSLLEQWNRDEH